MKKLLLFVFAALALAACTQTTVEVEVVDRHDSHDTLTIGFEGEDTRIQLNEAQKTVWTKGDLVSIFYRSNANEKWQYQGETGARQGTVKRVSAPASTKELSRIVVVYPYNEDYYINPESCNVEAMLPATQHYMEGSYGLDGNIMVSSSEYKQFSLKNVCGWLKLQLKGDGEVVKSIKLYGNNGEQVAGELYINTSDATSVLASEMGGLSDDEMGDETGGVGGGILVDDTILTAVTLDCGDGVTLGAEATAFYIALPPQTFEKGFTVEIEDVDGYVMEKSTNNVVDIERNVILPMTVFEFNNPNTQPTPVLANNEIWYTSSDGNIVTPERTGTDYFGATIISNTYSNGRGVITFDSDVTMIGAYAFSNCDNLTSITIPDSVWAIASYAFAQCHNLTSVNIPDNVTAIGMMAFSSCSSLISINIPDGVTELYAQAFQYCVNLKSVIIGDSVTAIKAATFQYCINLESVIIGDSVTEIGNNAFAYCRSLASVVIPDSVTTIGSGAFRHCSSLTSVTIPDSVVTIASLAFDFCDSLTSVSIGDGVTTIADRAFRYCTSLISVYCKATTPPSLDDSFLPNAESRMFYVPVEAVEAYKSADSWSEYASAIVGYDFEKGEIVEMQPNNEIWYTASEKVVPYNSSAFNSSIQSHEWDSTTGKGVITFNDEVTIIGDSAFYECACLTSISLPNSLTQLGYDALRGCANITSITFPESLSRIGDYAMEKCSKLSSLYFKGATPPSVGNFTLTNVSSDIKIYVPAGSVEAYKSVANWSWYGFPFIAYDFEKGEVVE